MPPVYEQDKNEEQPNRDRFNSLEDPFPSSLSLSLPLSMSISRFFRANTNMGRLHFLLHPF